MIVYLRLSDGELFCFFLMIIFWDFVILIENGWFSCLLEDFNCVNLIGYG